MICMTITFLLTLVRIKEIKNFACQKNFKISNSNGFYFALILYDTSIFPLKTVYLSVHH